MKRLLAVLLTLILLVGTLGTFAMPVSAAGKETILVAGSDFQVVGFKTDGVESLLETLSIFGVTKADRAFFCGDYTIEKMESATSQLGIQKLKDIFEPLVGKQTLFIQGNHDIETTAGLARAGNNDPANKAYGAFVINEDQYREWGNDRKVTEKVANSLRIYLEQKHSQGFKKPVFVLCHVPLHRSNRKGATDGDLIFNVLNEYGKKGLNILFLYGHNHSGGYDDFMGGAAVYLKKGDTLEVCYNSNTKEYKTHTLNFTYMNAGFIGYYSTTEAATDAAITMSVFRIQEDGAVIITRYDKNGIHPLKSKGVWHPDHNKEGYNATPNVLEYASSRKVTATDDVPVAPPVPAPTTTTAFTTTEYTTTTRNGGMVISKPTGTVTTQAGKTTSSTADAAPEVSTTKDETVVTNGGEESVEETKTTTAAQSTASPTPLIPWYAWLGMGVVALLLIGAIVAIIILSRPIK